jgi:hypothetical protein
MDRPLSTIPVFLLLPLVWAIPQTPAPAEEAAPVAITTVDLSPTYPWDPGKDFDRPFSPEIEAEASTVKWRKEVEIGEDGFLNLNDKYGDPTNVVIYARVCLESDTAIATRFTMGSDDGLTLVLNGKKVFAKNAMRGLKANEDAVDASLVKGRNVLLFRVTQGTGGFALQFAVRPLGKAFVAQVHDELPAKARIAFTLDAESITSAGIFDAQGRLVRTLWRMRRFPAGPQERPWDGLDEFEKPAPSGEYRFKVVVNHAVYANVGAIGNSGLPPDAKNHTPTHIHDVAVDAGGAVYTVNYWDEAGADFKKWDPNGTSVYDAQYQMRNGTPNGAPYACAIDDQYLYCTMEGWPGEQWKNRQQVQRFRLADGKHEKFTGVGREDGHINIYEEPEKLIPAGTPKEDADLMHWPLRDIEVLKDTLLVADTLGGRVLRFHKVTGKPEGEFKVKFPTAIAADNTGKIWIGHERQKVGVFANDGSFEREALSDLGEVKALAFGPDGKLYVADAKAGQVKIYDVSATPPKLAGTLGRKAVPGDRAADRFFDLRGVAVDRQGFIATAQNEPMGGARVARWTPDGRLLWEQFGTMFVSLANYGRHDPDTLYSMHFHRYKLKDRAKGTWDYTGNVYPGEGKGHCSDVHGVPRILKLGTAQAEFVVYPTGDGVQTWRVTPQGLRLAALLGGRDPDSSGVRERDGNKIGKWAWTSSNKDGGLPRPEEIRWSRKPGEKEAPYAVFGMDVDPLGHVWFGELHSRAIWTIPLKECNAAGNPVYDWSDAKQFAPRDESPLKFEPNMVQRAEDGSVYAFGWSAAWPSPKNNPFWMGGTTLVKFSAKGERQWAVKLPSVCVGLDVVPGGGGCMAGSGAAAAIFHFNADGLLIGTMKPGEAMCKESGWMDNHASVAVNRDPRDGLLDVFAEDDYVLRVGWYRVDDRAIRTIEGALRLP